MAIEDRYIDGRYLEATETWHSEDSPWKAEQINKMIDKNKIQPRVIAEIGCGGGSILDELSKRPGLTSVSFEGYDISPHAIEIAIQFESERIKFFKEDLLSEDNRKYFDVLMVIDVFEHVPDYLEFISRCRAKATYKIYHIPLDIHVSSVLRNSFIQSRYTIGHLHYFTAESAICALRDTGHEIIDSFYTSGAFGVFKEHPKIKTAVANVPRWLLSKISLPFTARLFGGYSLLVLAK